MARMTPVADSFQLLVDWESAQGVTDEALAATWCRLEVRVGDCTVTAVDDTRISAMRRAVHTSAYPLAEWIAEHWWSLSQHVRPSAVPHSLWSWSQVRQQTWLCSHNTRAAGAGMPWPDLTVMPEGSFSRLLWNSGPALAGQPLTFLTSGSALVRCEAVAEALGRFVDQILERLDDSGIRDTALHKEWRLLQECDDEETAFAVAAARLGLDPFDVAVDTEAEILSLAAATSDEALLNEILDTADPGQLVETAGWLAEARSAASYRQRPVLLDPASGPDPARPWRTGYDTALSYRRQSLFDGKAPFPVEDFVGLERIDARAGALPGVVSANASGVGLVLPHQSFGTRTSQRFAQARALGLSLLSDRTLFILDPASTDLARAARAFAAECLAPAESIAASTAGKGDGAVPAFEELAELYGVSPMVIRHQYENQFAA